MQEYILIKTIIIYHTCWDHEIVLIVMLFWDHSILFTKHSFLEMLVHFLFFGYLHKTITDIHTCKSEEAHLLQKLSNIALTTSNIKDLTFQSILRVKLFHEKRTNLWWETSTHVLILIFLRDITKSTLHGFFSELSFGVLYFFNRNLFWWFYT